MTRSLPDSIRDRFPLLKEAVYTNSCSQGALSVDVRAAYDRYLTDWDEKGAPWDLWVELNESARSRFARLLNASNDEIAVTTSVSAGVSSLLSGLRHPDGRNKIVLSDFEFPTIGQIVHAQELAGTKVEHVPASPEATIPLDRLAEAIDDETALVAITYVCFRNGSKTDIEAVIDLAHQAGAYVLVDAFQAVGAIPIDVRDLGVDFVAGGTLKYLLGSAGLASSTADQTCWLRSLRLRRAGSPTRTSLQWISTTTHRRRLLRSSRAAPRRCRASTRESRGWTS